MDVDLSDAGPQSGGDAEGDTLARIENLIGSANADTLTGDGGANVIDGGAGDDLIEGGAGGDAIDGGADSDTASYAVLSLQLTWTSPTEWRRAAAMRQATRSPALKT